MLVRNVLSNWVAIVVTGVLSFVLTPILIYSLGDFYYGMWILLMSILGHYGLLDLGIRTTLNRFVARLKGRNERVALNATIATALAMSFGISFLLAGLTLAMMFFLPKLFVAEAPDQFVFRWLILLLGLNIAVLFPARVLGAYLCGLQRFDLFNFANIATAIVRAGLIVALLYSGYGVLGIGAVTLGVGVLLLIINWRLVRRADPEIALNWRQTNWARIRELANFSFYVFVASLGNYLRFQIDSIVIAQVLTISLITPFSIAHRLMLYFAAVLGGLIGPLMPRMSELEGKGSLAELRQLFLHGTKAAALLSLLIGSLLLLNGKTLLALWLGERFLGTYSLIMLLTAGYAVALAQGPCNTLIFATNRHRLWGWITLAEGVANLLLSIYWARKYGLFGVALGTAVPMLVVGLLVKPWYALRIVKLSAQEYVREALARPMFTALLFLGLCYLTSHGQIQNSIGSFVLTLAWQSSLFAVLAYAVGLAEHERQIVARRCKYVVVLVFRLART